MAEKTRKKISRKMICIICGILAVIVVLTSLIFAFSKKENSTVLQATKSTANAVNLENNEHMHVEEDASGDKVPVPNGYVGSSVEGENEIDTGYVIYEGEEEVIDSNVTDAQKNRNQYVWIPVSDISKFYGIDANGKKWGKQYEFSSSTSSIYDEITGTKPNNWSESNGVMTISSKTSYREPDVVPKSSSTAYDSDSRLKTLGLGAKTTHEFLNQLEKEFNNMIASVEKYGGFYIKGANTNVETGMIWGNQWDRTLMWLIETGSKTKEQIAVDSKSWGNYSNATFEYVNSSGSTATKNENSSTRIPTGSTEYTKANNIYDLAGNVWDRIMEAYSTGYRASRGGYSGNHGAYDPADGRGYDGPTSNGSYLRLSCSTLHKVILSNQN